MNEERYLTPEGPPSSPPKVALLSPKMMKQTQEVMRNSMTEKARFPGGVMNLSFLLLW